MTAIPAYPSAGPVSESESREVLGLATNPVLRRVWLLHLAQKSLPFDQAIEWAGKAEQFITSSTTETQPALLDDVSSGRRLGGASMRDAVLQLLRDNPGGLSRGEVLEQLHLKGNKTGETAVSNALTALTKGQEIVRRERKYLAQ